MFQAILTAQPPDKWRKFTSDGRKGKDGVLAKIEEKYPAWWDGQGNAIDHVDLGTLRRELKAQLGPSRTYRSGVACQLKIHPKLPDGRKLVQQLTAERMMPFEFEIKSVPHPLEFNETQAWRNALRMRLKFEKFGIDFNDITMLGTGEDSENPIIFEYLYGDNIVEPDEIRAMLEDDNIKSLTFLYTVREVEFLDFERMTSIPESIRPWMQFEEGGDVVPTGG